MANTLGEGDTLGEDDTLGEAGKGEHKVPPYGAERSECADRMRQRIVGANLVFALPARVHIAYVRPAQY